MKQYMALLSHHKGSSKAGSQRENKEDKSYGKRLVRGLINIIVGTNEE